MKNRTRTRTANQTTKRRSRQKSARKLARNRARKNAKTSKQNTNIQWKLKKLTVRKLRRMTWMILWKTFSFQTWMNDTALCRGPFKHWQARLLEPYVAVSYPRAGRHARENHEVSNVTNSLPTCCEQLPRFNLTVFFMTQFPSSRLPKSLKTFPNCSIWRFLNIKE